MRCGFSAEPARPGAGAVIAGAGGVVTQSAMPVVVFNYQFLFAVCSPEPVASPVLCSTFLAFGLLLPLLAWWLSTVR
ncbi:hypothetical protein GCM10027514_34380 [Azotobacter armeniacus]